MAYVVILHLDPTYRSQMSEILAQATAMPVEEVTGRAKIQPDRIYVIAPDRELVISEDHIEARPFAEPRGHRAPIDVFFRSLAAGRGDGIAIVLTGAGPDGAVGVRAVKEGGGVIFVQEPRDAEYPVMPQSAIATGVADFILPLDEMAGRIAEVVRSKLAMRSLKEADAEATVRRIIAFLRARSGHDFANYKRTTFVRRIMRRMQVTRMQALGEYESYLRDNAEEAHELFRDLLISVTMFFRDTAAFEALATDAIPSLFEGREPGREVRVWVPGCATGEEAYTLAMLLREEMLRRKVEFRVQIFATDLDDGARSTAREGRYPASIEADVSQDRLARFFVRDGQHYRLRKDLREMVLFATHSTLKDPPFLRLDLISCRNLLIYLDRELQRQICATFHYALLPDGVLFLGSAERVDHVPELFRTVHEARIFRSKAQAPRQLPIPLVRGPAPHVPFAGGRPARDTDPAAGAAAAHGAALERLAPPQRARGRGASCRASLGDRRPVHPALARRAQHRAHRDAAPRAPARRRERAAPRVREGRDDAHPAGRGRLRRRAARRHRPDPPDT